MASCTKCEKSKLSQTTEHAEQIHRDSIEFVQNREMQVFRFSVFSLCQAPRDDNPKPVAQFGARRGSWGSWQRLLRRESHEVQTRFGAFGWGQCMSDMSVSQESLESPERIEERLGSILFDKVRFGKALKAQNLFGSVFASTLSLRRHHVDMWVDTIS